ncbi:MAG: DUF4336 domain-containing protein, partial [Candidatus Binataceae bacterium]
DFGASKSRIFTKSMMGRGRPNIDREVGAPLKSVAPGLWVAERLLRLPYALGWLPSRMTVIKLANGALFLHSPILLDAPTRVALDELGPVRQIVAPSKAHHSFVADYIKAYPNARVHGALGLAEKRRDLKFHHLLGFDWPHTDWEGQIKQHLFRGASSLNEMVFFHTATRTLLLSDLIFNLTRDQAAQARMFHWVTGAAGRVGPHRLVRRMISDRTAARWSVETILRWDFDRVIVSHGNVIETDGRAHVRAAFSFLWS